MSPAMTASQDQRGDRPAQRPYPSADVLLCLSREIVVDWQLPADADRRN